MGKRPMRSPGLQYAEGCEGVSFWSYVPAYPPCAGRAQTGTSNLQLAILERFDRAYDAGIYSCRQIVGGSAPSIHSDGRAGDVGFPRLHIQGYQLVEALRSQARGLGVMGIIWDRRRYDWRTPWGRLYSGSDAHTTHVHYEMEPNLAKTLTLPRARYLIGEPMAFTPAEETILKTVAAYGDVLTELARGLISPGPTTGRIGNGLSLIHLLEVHRVVSDRTGVSPVDHVGLATRLLGQ